MADARGKQIESLHQFSHEIMQVANDVQDTAGYITSGAFEMRGLATMQVDRVAAAKDALEQELEAAEREYDDYVSGGSEDVNPATEASLREAVREASQRLAEAEADYNVIRGLQAQLEGYCSVLYSLLDSQCSQIGCTLEILGGKVDQEAAILEDYRQV